VENGAGLLRYVLPHQRDDRVAWSALTAALEANGSTAEYERGEVEYLLFPFWLFVRDNGVNRLVPAADHPCRELTTVTLPGGDLQFLAADVEVIPPTVPSAAAQKKLPVGGSVRSASLVYLPLYVIGYLHGGHEWQALVSGVDRKLYALELPLPAPLSLPVRHLVMLGGFALMLLIEGWLLKPLPWRAAGFAATFSLIYPAYYTMLRREL
jgi:hypothetical protein